MKMKRLLSLLCALLCFAFCANEVFASPDCLSETCLGDEGDGSRAGSIKKRRKQRKARMHLLSSYYSSETVYMNDEGDGSITVRAYGHGRNRSDARAQAAKNALRDVIFRGVQVPGNALLSKPLVTTLNAEEKHQAFFDAFFVDGGDYERFVSTADRKAHSDNKEKNSVQVKEATTLRIQRPALRQYLIEKGVIIP